MNLETIHKENIFQVLKMGELSEEIKKHSIEHTVTHIKMEGIMSTRIG